MKNVLITAAAVLPFFFSGCETQLSETESGALAGSALGAGLGAIVGEQHGEAGAGTAIGAGTGAVAGGLIGEGIRRSGSDDPSQQRQTDTRSAAGTAGVYEQHTKYCPTGGKTYPPDINYCPLHGTELQPIR